jgi:hypothetical protein
MVQTLTGNLVEVSSAVRIEIFNGVNSLNDTFLFPNIYIMEMEKYNKNIKNYVCNCWHYITSKL